MNNKIKPFVKRLIIDYIFYIFANILIVILIFIIFQIGGSQILNYKSKIDNLTVENSDLMRKVNIMNGAVPSADILDEDIKFLNRLIPNVEDYFSIIGALEKLSQKSNFIITGYTVIINKKSPEKLQINVSGEGDSQSFIEFLKNYNFSGGRLITSNKVGLDPNFSGSIIIELNFYSKKTESDSQLNSNPDLSVFSEIDVLKSKVNFNFADVSASESASLDYPKKENPF